MSAHYRRQAWKRWPHAQWIAGDGPFAVLAHCPTVMVRPECLTIELHDTAASAIVARWAIDTAGCGSACLGARGHRIVRLAASDVRGRRAA